MPHPSGNSIDWDWRGSRGLHIAHHTAVQAIWHVAIRALLTYSGALGCGADSEKQKGKGSWSGRDALNKRPIRRFVPALKPSSECRPCKWRARSCCCLGAEPAIFRPNDVWWEFFLSPRNTQIWGLIRMLRSWMSFSEMHINNRSKGFWRSQIDSDIR